MITPNLPIADPRSISMTTNFAQWEFVQWETHLQQVAADVCELQVMPTENLNLRLMRDQYVTKSQELLEAARNWYESSDTNQKMTAFQMMTQKYAILNSLWLQITSLSRRLSDPIEG
jgi:hypothetical protein